MKKLPRYVQIIIIIMITCLVIPLAIAVRIWEKFMRAHFNRTLSREY